MLVTTVGQLVVNEVLPPELRNYDRVIDKNELTKMMRFLAVKYPDKYVEITKKLGDISKEAGTEAGGTTFGLSHLQKAKASQKYFEEIRNQLKNVLNDPNIDNKTRQKLITDTLKNYADKLEKAVFEESLQEENPLALQVATGARGKAANLASLRASDLMYSDNDDKPIPIPIFRSYAEGLSPIEYWAGTYGARKGVVATKLATQRAGFLSKQLNQIMHRLVVTDIDEPSDNNQNADRPIRGYPVDTDDPDNIGACLAVPIGPYKRNTVITPKVISTLKNLGIKRILVRSPIVSSNPDDGLYAYDVGVRERLGLPGRGELVGLTAAQAISEPISQGQLNVKHSGGIAGKEKTFSGFHFINQLIQGARSFHQSATHSDVDGVVTKIEPAPAGGHYVYVNQQRFYVKPDQKVIVKEGDEIEAGDVLSDGLPNPSIIVEHKGIGEGRKYFIDVFRRTAEVSSVKANRRNIELLARGLINFVELDEEIGDYVPGDIVKYSEIESSYQPRPDAKKVDLKSAKNKFLETPVLHYTIGTQLKPSVIKTLQEFGINEVYVHDKPPPFKPTFVRGMTALQNDPDWMTRMYGSGLKSGLLEAVYRGRSSDETSTSFVPGLARAKDFGSIGKVKKPEPTIPIKEYAEELVKLSSLLNFFKSAQPQQGGGGSNNNQNPYSYTPAGVQVNVVSPSHVGTSSNNLHLQNNNTNNQSNTTVLGSTSAGSPRPYIVNNNSQSGYSGYTNPYSNVLNQQQRQQQQLQQGQPYNEQHYKFLTSTLQAAKMLSSTAPDSMYGFQNESIAYSPAFYYEMARRTGNTQAAEFFEQILRNLNVYLPTGLMGAGQQQPPPPPPPPNPNAGTAGGGGGGAPNEGSGQPGNNDSNIHQYIAAAGLGGLASIPIIRRLVQWWRGGGGGGGGGGGRVGLLGRLFGGGGSALPTSSAGTTSGGPNKQGLGWKGGLISLGAGLFSYFLNKEIDKTLQRDPRLDDPNLSPEERRRLQYYEDLRQLNRSPILEAVKYISDRVAIGSGFASILPVINAIAIPLYFGSLAVGTGSRAIDLSIDFFTKEYIDQMVKNLEGAKQEFGVAPILGFSYSKERAFLNHDIHRLTYVLNMVPGAVHFLTDPRYIERALYPIIVIDKGRIKEFIRDNPGFAAVQNLEELLRELENQITQHSRYHPSQSPRERLNKLLKLSGRQYLDHTQAIDRVIVVPSINEVYDLLWLTYMNPTPVSYKIEPISPDRSKKAARAYLPRLNIVHDDYLYERTRNAHWSVPFSKVLLPNWGATNREKPVLTFQEFMSKKPINYENIQFGKGKEPSPYAIISIYRTLNTNVKAINYRVIADKLTSYKGLPQGLLSTNHILQNGIPWGNQGKAVHLTHSFGLSIGEVFTPENPSDPASKLVVHPRIRSLIESEYHKKKMESLNLNPDNFLHVLGYLRSLVDTVAFSDIDVYSPQLYYYLTGVPEQNQQTVKGKINPSLAHGLLLAEIMPKLDMIHESYIQNSLQYNNTPGNR